MLHYVHQLFSIVSRLLSGPEQVVCIFEVCQMKSWLINTELILLLQGVRPVIVSPSFPLTATDPQQWEAGSVGQTAATFEGARPQSSHLLPDGTDAGYPGWISEKPTVPLSGSYTLFSLNHQFSTHTYTDMSHKSSPRFLFHLTRKYEMKLTYFY